MIKKALSVITLSLLSVTTYASYEEIECTTDSVFSEYSCNQCFDWGSKKQGDNLGLLSDVWMNVTDVDKLLYKEEQLDPEMNSLDPENVVWNQIPSSENFWTYTDEFNSLYSDLEEGYVLPSWESVKWIETNLSSAYNLEQNTAKAWSNIGLLTYSIYTHNILADGEITIDSNEHKECVLFKSEEGEEETPEEPKKLPETGSAEFLLLAIIAMILGFGVLQFRTKN